MTAYAGGITEIEDLSEISGFVVCKFADTSINTDATLNDDPDLVTPTLEANSTWVIDGWLWWTASGTTPDLKVAFNGPAGADVVWSFISIITSATSNSGAIDIGVQSGGLLATHARVALNGSTGGLVRGYVTIGGTAGAMTLQWAQNTSDAGAVVLKEGSHIRWRRIL